MKSWARVYGGIGVVAAVVIFIALIYGVWQENLKFGTDTFEQFVAKDHVLFLFATAGAIMFYSGIIATIDGLKTERSWATVYGVILMAAGAMFALILYGHAHSITDSASLSWNDGLRYLCVVFMLLTAVACGREAADRCYGLAVVDAIMFVVVALAFYVDTEKDISFLKGLWFPIAVALAVLVVSITPVAARRSVARREAIAAEREARIAAALKAEDEAEAAKRQAELQRQFEARKAAQEKARAEEKARQEAAAAAAAKKAADEAAAKKAAEEAAAKKAAEEAAAKKAAEEEAARKAAEEEAAWKAMEEQRAAELAAQQKAADEQRTAELLAQQKAVEDAARVAAEYQAQLQEEQMARKAAEERAAALLAAQQAAEAQRAADEEAVRKAAEEEAEKQKAAEIAEAERRAREEAEKQKAAEIAEAENRAREEAYAKYEARLREEEAARRAAEERAVNALSEANVSKIAAAAAAATAATAVVAPTSEPETRTEEVLLIKDETLDLTLQDLGIEEETPTTFVRRASWNKGLRCRRDYGLKKVPIAFVKGKVAVFVDPDGTPADAARDEALEEEGWKVLHFRESDVTDGEAQADVIAAAVKENLRAEKAAKSKAAKKKAAKKKA